MAGPLQSSLFIICIGLVSPAFSSELQAHQIHQISLPLTAKNAAKLVQLETDGKVLSVEKSTKDNQTVFRVKVLHNNGKVKIHILDAETGYSLR